MGKKKTVQNTNQSSSYNNSNRYDFLSAPDTPDMQAFREWKPQIDPGLGAQYGAAKQRLQSSFDDPLGGFSTPQTRDAQLRTGMRNLNQDESQAFRQGTYDVNSQRQGQLGTVAALTRPNLVQTGASGTGQAQGTGTTTQSGGLLGDLAVGAMGGGKRRGA